MKPTLNERRALVRRVCRSCWGHSLLGWRSWAAGQQTRNSREWTRTDTAAADSTLSAVGSIPVQGNKLAEDSSRLVAAHSRAAAPQTRKLCPVPNPSRRRANPSPTPPAVPASSAPATVPAAAAAVPLSLGAGERQNRGQSESR